MKKEILSGLTFPTYSSPQKGLYLDFVTIKIILLAFSEILIMNTSDISEELETIIHLNIEGKGGSRFPPEFISKSFLIQIGYCSLTVSS